MLVNQIKNQLLKKSTVKKNFISLALLQVANYFFPFITIPYISRIFGPEKFGVLNFALAFTSYGLLIVNFGFELYSSREISINRDNKDKIEQIFNSTITAKLYLGLVSYILLVITALFVKQISEFSTLYFLLFAGNIASIFLTMWFFQGMEKMTISAMLNFVVKLIFTVLIFILIKSQSDFILYPIALLAGQIISGIVSIVLISKQFKIKIKLVSFKSVKRIIRESVHLFLISVTTNLYTTTNIVLLGFIATNYDVGIFSAAQKIVAVVMAMINMPIMQALYPSIGYSFSKSLQEGLSKIVKAFFLICIISLLPSLVLFLFPNIFIHILFPKTFDASIETLRILAFLPFIIALSNLFGIQGLVNLKKDHLVNIITLCGAVIGISLNFLLVPAFKFKSDGSALSWLITEIFITTVMFIVFAKNSNFIRELKNISFKVFKAG